MEMAARDELRGIIYLLSELKVWETQGLIAVEAAASLRSRYESRREALRAQIDANGDRASGGVPLPAADETTAANARAPEAAKGLTTAAEEAGQASGATVARARRDNLAGALFSRLTARAARPAAAGATRAPRRPLFETLADPHTLRLLLYVGAAMLVVGIVIWLRDVLYLKLQEPLVQAVLLALGTIGVMVSGWLMTLRTRLLLTGRTLALIGSLLVPVNFWFLVRSGLISDNGRAWMVCVLCAALYAQTAALLRERLYVYLACTASVAAMWALVYRATPEAYGLYSLTTMTGSLVFVHLSRVFPRASREVETERATSGAAKEAGAGEVRALASRWSYEVWGLAMARVAVAGAGASALLYMLLRVEASPSFAGRVFDWRSSDYNALLAVVLFAAGAYVAWFAASFIYTNRRAVFYTTSVLALMWTEFLLLDGLRLAGRARLITMSATALVAAACAVRFVRERILAAAVVRASATVLTVLFVVSSVIALVFHAAAGELDASWRLAVFFALAAAVLFGLLRGPGGAGRSVYGAGLAASAAMVLVAAALDALQAASVLPSSWPIAGGVVCAAFVMGRLCAGRGERTAAGATEKGGELWRGLAVERLVRVVSDGAVTVCALLWFGRTLAWTDEVGGSAALVLLLASSYWAERAAHQKRALFAYVASAHAGAFTLALLLAFGVERRWLAFVFTLALFPAFFALGQYALARRIGWLARPLKEAAAMLAMLAAVALMVDAAPVLQAGNALLLAPSMTAGALCVATMAASLFSAGQERLNYFRAGLGAAVAAFALAVLRAGYDPIVDVEAYTSPVAVLSLLVAYVSARREWDEHAGDTGLLLWAGSLLLCGPLLLRALQFRLLMDVAAPWRDMLVLCVSLALVFFGVMGRLRAPVIVGTVTLLLELVAVSLTSVEWLQVPLRVYLITAGVLSIIVWGIFEYRRERILVLRQRLHERSTTAREQFNDWR